MADIQIQSPGPSLPPITGVLAVVAHPDDESFALGALLDRLADGGARSAVLCFTSGEASTLHLGAGKLSAIRAGELRAAAAVLRLNRVELLHYPDGGLAGVPVGELAHHVLRLIADERPSHLLVFDRGGVTGHPDHDGATEAALAAARVVGLPVLAWALPEPVARQLNTELNTGFVGRPAEQLDMTWAVSRQRQWRAIDCHRSQSTDNPVLHRRLRLLGDVEHLRLLYQPCRPEAVCDEGVKNMSYALSVRLPAAFAPTVERVRTALKEQGFGVLTEIDLRATMQEKLGVEMEEYLILGACNPPLAHQAIDADRNIGLLLPCNVVVRADGPDTTLVQALDPQVMVQVTGKAELTSVADEATRRLRAALDALAR